MKISVITVCYNSSLTIKHTIESVLSQSYTDIEYIVIDGASTDHTPAIINYYGNRITKFLSEPDEGIYDAINKGIRMASGDIIGILNSDDIFADDTVVARIAEAFKANLFAEAVYSDIVFVDGTHEKTLRYYSSKKFRPWMFKFGFQPAHPTFYVKRHVFEKYGLYRTDLKIAGDFEFLARLLQKHKIRSKYIEDVWVKMKPGGVTTSSLKNIVRTNGEDLFACKINGIYSNHIMIYSKYLFKWWGFLFKR